ncbi:putative glutathione synthetase [Actinobacillus pleuropneumoniae]|nr:putative glutathione synthetase [Actinobacillus pleuropneumoniae]
MLPVAPLQNIVRQARDVLMRLPEMPSYARVDGTIIGDRFLLNELELIEPALYLHTDPQAAVRFTQVLMQK